MTPNATYQIWCRTEEVSPGKHLVTVFAMPVPCVDGAEIASESRLFASSHVAKVEADRMTVAMSARLIAAGHGVTRVTILGAGEGRPATDEPATRQP